MAVPSAWLETRWYLVQDPAELHRIIQRASHLTHRQASICHLALGKYVFMLREYRTQQSIDVRIQVSLLVDLSARHGLQITTVGRAGKVVVE